MGFWGGLGGNRSQRSPLNRSKRFQELIYVHELIDRIDLGKDDFAGLVYDEGGALADAGDGRAFTQNTKLARDGGVRIEVGAHRELDGANFFFTPRDVAGDGIDADVQNLGIEGRELLGARVEFGDLRGSSRGPVERMEGDDELLLAEVVAGADGDARGSGDGGKLEVRGGVTYVQHA